MPAIYFTHYADDGDEIDMVLPGRNELCRRCDGNGTHVNPAIDGNGLTSDDIYDLGGDDFLDDYLGGTYDTVCEQCRGDKVVVVPDEGRADPDVLAAYHQHQREEAKWAAEIAAERRMGA